MTTKGYWTEGKIVNGTNVGGGVFVPGDPPAAATSTPTSANPLFDPSLYTPTKTADQIALDNANIERTNAYGMSLDPSESDRASALSKFQGQIDALNQVYAEEKRAAALAGRNRLGQNTAIQARRGLLGSDFGSAATDAVNTANEEVQKSIDAKHNLAISAIYGSIDAAAVAAANARVSAAQKGADAKIAEIKGRQEAASNAVNSAVKAYFASGNDGTKLTDQNIKDWAAKLGVSTDVVVNAVKDAKTAADKEAKANNPDVTLSQGQSKFVWNPSTGKYEKVASVAPAANAYNSGGGTSGYNYVAGADPVVDSHISNVLNGNETMAQVPANIRNAVSVGLTKQPKSSYSPLAASRFTIAATRIASNFIHLPQFQLTANGLPYLQRIDAAIKQPGSVSDQDLLDSITKLNTAGNAITEAQVKVITDGKSLADAFSVYKNKLSNGGVLSDSQRNQIKDLANATYANYKKGYQPVYDQVTKQLGEAGIPQAFWTIPDLNTLSAQAGSDVVGSSGGSIQERATNAGYDYNAMINAGYSDKEIEAALNQ